MPWRDWLKSAQKLLRRQAGVRGAHDSRSTAERCDPATERTILTSTDVFAASELKLNDQPGNPEERRVAMGVDRSSANSASDETTQRNSREDSSPECEATFLSRRGDDESTAVLPDGQPTPEREETMLSRRDDEEPTAVLPDEQASPKDKSPVEIASDDVDHPANLSDGQQDPTGNATVDFVPDDAAARDRPATQVLAASTVTVPGYDILSELGRGGMGVVYRARQQTLQREVALKMILAGAHSGSDGMARFRAEAESVARLQHPNIVQVFEIGEHEGRPFFSLELVEGGSLKERISAAPPTPTAAGALIETLARAIGFAHQRGIIHRDLKPANILLASIDPQETQKLKRRSSGTWNSGSEWLRTVSPKITDFGLAKRIDDDTGQTNTGTILGTPNYMSPEQASGRIRDIGPASDIYALGVMLYEMLVGRPPFRGGNAIEVIRQVIEVDPVPPRQLEPRVPLDVETICLKCLEKQPERRYSTAEELADDLHRFLNNEPILARPISLTERTWKWAKRRPSTVALLAMTLAAIVGSVMFMMWHNVSLSEKLDEALAEQAQAHRRETDAIEAREQQEKEAAEAQALLQKEAEDARRLAKQEVEDAQRKAEDARQLAMKEAAEVQRLSQIRNAAQQQFDGARVALAAGNLADARIELTKALTVLRSEPQLVDIQDPAEVLLKRVEQDLSNAADRLASQTRFVGFVALRDEAQFLGSLYTGMDLAENLKASRSAVHAALAVYGVSIPNVREGEAPADPPTAEPPAAEQLESPEVLTASQSPLVVDINLTEAQRAEILGDCYQLLLILAETEAQSALDLKQAEQDTRLRKAVRVLDKALEFGTPSRAWHLRQARYLSILGDKAAAAKAEQTAEAAGVADVFDQFLMADEFYRRAEFDDAIREFENVLQAKPDHFWAQYLSGLCLLRQNRHSEARSHLTACLAQGRKFVWLYLLRGYANGELLAFEAAESDFKSALTLTRDENSRYVLLVNRGVLRIRQERFDDAIADLGAAIKLKPGDYQAYVNLAQSHRLAGDLDTALAQLDRAVQREPSLAHVYRLRARLRVERGESDPALDDFRNAIRLEDPLSPFLADDHFECGRLLLRSGQHEPALASFDGALKLKSSHSLALRLQAETLFHLGRFEEVIETFNRYLKSSAPLESVYRGRGLARSELGQFPGAIDDFTKALELKPTSAVQAYRGWMHVIVGATQLAERDFELAIELDPTNSDAFNGRGFVRAIQKDFPGAMSDAERSVELGPPSSRLFYNAARIHAQFPGPINLKVFELITESLKLLPEEQRATFWSNQINTDSALNTIRRHPKYRELQAEYPTAGSEK
jgi:serine/threonine protein kinase/tetratricopeptide (TPR) repeat protein